MITLAQANLDAVPATIFKWVVVIILGLAVAAAFIWTAFHRERAPKSVASEPKQPSQRYNHVLTEERHRNMLIRLNQTEADIKAIQESRIKTEKRFNRIWIVLTRIATKMNIDTPQDEDDGGDL